MRAHVLQHVPFEGLGTIAPWLERRRAEVTVTRFFDGGALPNPRDVDLVIALGGPMSVNDEATWPWLVDEKQFLGEVLENGARVLGICLGAQLVAGALGARIYPNDEKEIGWFPISTTPDSGLVDGSNVFHWHGETFDLPRGAERIASSKGCVNQAFRIGDSVLALQFHLEVTPEGVRAMVEHCRHELEYARYVHSEREIMNAPARLYERANQGLEQLLTRFVGDGLGVGEPRFRKTSD
jgi:GMP synthase-like glutamine amidotransferase